MDFIPIKVTDKALEAFRKDVSAVLLGKDILEKYSDQYPWKIGGTYIPAGLGDISIKVVGIYESDNPVYNTIMLADRTYLQEASDDLGVAQQIYVKIDHPDNAREVITEIDTRISLEFSCKTKTVDQRAFLTAAMTDLKDIIDLSRWVMLITLGVILIAVANTISMATRDRIQEIGILRAMGFQRSQIVSLVVAESLLMSIAGGLLGLLTAWIFVNFDYAPMGVNILLHVTPAVAVTAVVISIVVGFAGGILPALGASRVSIVGAIRNVD